VRYDDIVAVNVLSSEMWHSVEEYYVLQVEAACSSKMLVPMWIIFMPKLKYVVSCPREQ